MFNEIIIKLLIFDTFEFIVIQINVLLSSIKVVVELI